MSDAVGVLRAHGILIPEVMVDAALREHVELAVAAAILEGESSGGHNIWGHDTTRTAGTYTPGGPVTEANYRAYRDRMRAGHIPRNGVGPTQATSAQYQDTADALGGCWDPLANCRSGFRGMGALIRRFGVRLGAQHYNGSGPAAVAYGQRFFGRYQRWSGLLAGTDTGMPPPPPPVDIIRPPLGTELVMEPVPMSGQGTRRFFLDPPGASVIEDAWLSLLVDGPDGAAASVSCFPQHPGGGTGPERTLTANVLTDGSHTSSRDFLQVPHGTDQVTLQWSVSTGATAYLVPAFRAAR